MRQFVVQTHFESPMEVTPEAREAVSRLLSAGWIVTNQLVMTAASSRRGHSAKLRQVLNHIGVLPYYTFVVKGYMENQFNYAPVSRVVQEELEEKAYGRIPDKYRDTIRRMPEKPSKLVGNLESIREAAGLLFLATGRSVLNLPAVGKSLTFRVIGITRYGRRILEFDHDRTRAHSPIIDKKPKVIIIESKSIREFLRQLEEIGEDVAEYEDVWGYSLGQTEPRLPLHDYPEYDFAVTDRLTNFEMPEPDIGSSN